MTLGARKWQHIRSVIDDEASDRKQYYFDDIKLLYSALPEQDYDAIDLQTQFCGKNLSMPLIISSMTGGDHTDIIKINQRLARAAETYGVAMGVGSQRIMLAESEAVKSFKLRRFAPNIPLIANLGAVQLNEGVTVDDCRRIIDALKADALYLHLNPLQEVLQPEGDRNFAGLTEKIATVVNQLDVPVIIKEVGGGLSLDVAQRLSAVGVKHFDVAGTGGTSFAHIEGMRGEADMGRLFADMGIPTPYAIYTLAQNLESAYIIGSGGIRSGLDVAKAIVLGADICGMAKPFMEAAISSEDDVYQVLAGVQRALKIALFSVGAGQLSDIRGQSDRLLLKQV